MSKKNRRKTLSKQKESIVQKGDFSVDDSKIYIMITIVMFHILPLIFIMIGETGKYILSLSLVTTYPIFIAITGLIYGIKKGFNFKFPIIMAVLAVLSVFMYGVFADAAARMSTTIIEAVVYMIFAFASTFVGAFLRKMLNL